MVESLLVYVQHSLQLWARWSIWCFRPLLRHQKKYIWWVFGSDRARCTRAITKDPAEAGSLTFPGAHVSPSQLNRNPMSKTTQRQPSSFQPSVSGMGFDPFTFSIITLIDEMENADIRRKTRSPAVARAAQPRHERLRACRREMRSCGRCFCSLRSSLTTFVSCAL